MNPEIYRAAISGDWKTIKKLSTDFHTLKTPNGDTILHLLSRSPDSPAAADAVEEIIARYRSLASKTNNQNETPLVIASRRGHSHFVAALIDGTKKVVRNKTKALWALRYDCALFEAVRNNQYEVVQLLVREGIHFPTIRFPFEGYPLYLAAEKGYIDIVGLILSTGEPLFSALPLQKTALHAAVFRNSAECVKMILNKWPKLIKKSDAHGWNALHYATLFNHRVLVKLLLSQDNSLGYVPTKTDDFMCAIHIAVSKGHLDVAKEILSHCPDCWQMVTHKRKNILHLAVEHERKEMLEFILTSDWVPELINQRDADWNTPLHLYVSTKNLDGHDLINHRCVDRDAKNWFLDTPLSIIIGQEADKITPRQNLIKDELVKAGANPAMQNIDGAMLKRSTVSGESQKMEPYMVVTTLIVTVTFAAGFTVPGGYDGTQGNEGMAILSKQAAFTAFVVSDSFALMFSIIALLLQFAAVQSKRLAIFAIFSDLPLVYITFCMAFSMPLMVIAFLTGLYVVLPERSIRTYLIVVGSVVCLPMPLFLLRSFVRFVRGIRSYTSRAYDYDLRYIV